MMKDICCIGHVTKDKIVTPHRTVYMAGGTSFYFAYAINQLPKDVSFSLVTAMDPTETEPIEKMRQAGIDVTLNPSRNTVFFENIYEEDQNKRKQRVLAKADPFTIRQLEKVEAKVYHLGSLLSDDFSPEVVEFLSRSGRVSIDVQGYLREVRDEKVYPIDWKDKMTPSTRFPPILLTRWWMPQDAATRIRQVISTSDCRVPPLPKLASLLPPCAPSSWSTTVRSTAASRM